MWTYLKIQNSSEKDRHAEVAFIITLNSLAEIKNITFDNYSIKHFSIYTCVCEYKISGLVINNHGNILGVNFKNEVIRNNKYVEGYTTGFVFNNYKDGIIKNCYIKNVNAKDSKINSGFVEINHGKITNSSTTISANTFYIQYLVSGFVGKNFGIIEKCISTGNVTGHVITGGFVGENLYGIIKNCSSTGNVKGNKTAGGFCGNNSGKIQACTSSGSVIATNYEEKTKCGGFVGNNDEKGKISGCESTGSAKGEEYVGGFAGVNNSDIIDCNAHGKATAKTKTHTALAGGFVGENEKGTIIGCTATGGADSRSTSGQAKAGGFVGINKANIMSSKANGYVYLSAGTCYKDDGCGGFVGKNDKGGNIDGCYAEATVQTKNKKKGGGFVGEALNKSKIINSKCKTKIVTKAGLRIQKKFCQHKYQGAVI